MPHPQAEEIDALFDERGHTDRRATCDDGLGFFAILNFIAASFAAGWIIGMVWWG